MALCEKQNPLIYLEEEDHHDDYSGEFDSDCDSDMDPTYIILEETLDQLSDLSITKKSNPRIDKDQEGIHEKSFREVRSIIEAGKLEKLKVEQCKVYLRKNGLRLTGKKETLIQRIMEHHEILNGGGEKKYPVSSFVLNCKGDACTGDIVMFEQNVYEMYNIASRSASGPPCGTRIVVGRIVKESYGAAKQQHTFTIEVLWSKGEKPLPPLHPLLIKGRNLYRLKTLRQKWEDEGERQKILMEKYSRGSLARCARESRVQEKEMRKALRENRGLKMGRKRNQSQLNSTLKGNQGFQTQQLGSSVSCEEAAPKPRPSALYNDTAKKTIEAQRSGMPIDAVKMGGESQKQAIQPRHWGSLKVSSGPQQPAILHQHLGPFRPLQATLQPHNSGSLIGVVNTSSGTQKLQTHHQSDSLIDSVRPTNRACSVLPCQTEHKIGRENHNFYQVPGRSVDLRGIQEVHHNNNSYGSWLLSDQHHPVYMYPSTACRNGFSGQYHHRQTLTSMNLNQQRKKCKFYAQGRCYFGVNCKYLHDLGKNLSE